MENGRTGHSIQHIAHEMDSLREKLLKLHQEDLPEYDLGPENLDGRQMVDHANSIILRLDPQGVITFINRYAERFFGYTRDEIVGKNVIGTIVPERESTGRDLGEMIRDLARHPERYENNINENVTREGERVWIAWTNRVVDGKTGGETEIICIGNDITGLTRMRDQLRREERTYRTLFEASKDLIAIIDSEGCVLDINQAGLDLLGYEKKRVLGRRVPEFCASLEEYNKLRGHLEKYGATRNLELQLRKSTGKVLDCLVTTTVRDGDEESARIYQSFIYDITEKKRIECALRESERKLSIVVDSIPDIVYRLNPDGKISFISDSVRKYGYNPKELLGKSMYDIVHPDDLPKARYALMERRTGERRTRSLEIRLLAKSREAVPFSIDLRRVELEPTFILEAEGLYRGDRVADENFLGTQGVAHDITEQRRAEREIHESREQFRALFEANPEAVMLIDKETGRILDVNNSGMKIYGYSREEFGHLFREDIWAKSDTRDDKPREEFSVTPLHQHRKKDGSVFPAEITGSEIELLGHRMYLCAIRDVTDRLRAEEESLMREKLQGALEMAHAVCHEINQPLQVITGYAQLLTLEKTGDENFIRYMQEIQSAVQRMTEITWKLNNITRYETIDYVGNSKIIDINRASQS